MIIEWEVQDNSIKRGYIVNSYLNTLKEGLLDIYKSGKVFQ